MLIERGGRWYVQDPETGEIYPAIAGGSGIEEIAAIAGIASAVAGLGSTVYSLSQGGGGGVKMPSIPSIDTTQISKALLPGAKADAASRLGGGISPDFLANLIGQQSGSPGAGLDILGQIRGSLGEGQAP